RADRAGRADRGAAAVGRERVALHPHPGASLVRPHGRAAGRAGRGRRGARRRRAGVLPPPRPDLLTGVPFDPAFPGGPSPCPAGGPGRARPRHAPVVRSRRRKAHSAAAVRTAVKAVRAPTAVKDTSSRGYSPTCANGDRRTSPSERSRTG